MPTIQFAELTSEIRRRAAHRFDVAADDVAIGIRKVAGRWQAACEFCVFRARRGEDSKAALLGLLAMLREAKA
jgi:hypothetical protein